MVKYFYSQKLLHFFKTLQSDGNHWEKGTKMLHDEDHPLAAKFEESGKFSSKSKTH